jgi:hypothetical protein
MSPEFLGAGEQTFRFVSVDEVSELAPNSQPRNDLKASRSYETRTKKL